MKGISAKMVTDEETVRMHTNFAEFKNVFVQTANTDIATWSKEDGVLKVHTNTIRGWGLFAFCRIPLRLLKSGQRYGISVRSNMRSISIGLKDATQAHHGTEIVKAHWDGDKYSAVWMLDEKNLVDGLGIQSFLLANNTDYEIRDFRIWEIDDLGGVIVSILRIMLAATLRKEVAA